jgi:hypothetical protein
MNSMDLVPGTRLGPYEILARIGAGGMGTVKNSPILDPVRADPRYRALLATMNLS